VFNCLFGVNNVETVTRGHSHKLLVQQSRIDARKYFLADRCNATFGYCNQMSSAVCRLSVCRLLWPNGWTDQDETWHAGRPRPWLHCVSK